jgi:hypothetical protein
MNFILMRFSQGAEVFYETAEDLLEDLWAALRDLAHPERGSPLQLSHKFSPGLSSSNRMA